MKNDEWTVLFFRGETGPIQEVRLRARLLRTALGVGVSVLLVTVLVGSLVVPRLPGMDRLHGGHAAGGNTALVAELEETRDRLHALEEDLELLADRGNHLRLVAGLDTLSSDLLQVGVGGPGTPAPEGGHPLWSADATTAGDASFVRHDLRALERRARLLSASLAEATDSLEVRRDLLRATPSIFPTNGRLSSVFSSTRSHPIHHRPIPHEGIDLAAPEGTPIRATADGRVVRAGRNAGFGLLVELDHGNGYVTRYGHASRIEVEVGDQVERGEVIARVGSTGLTTGPHLHYEVRREGRPVDPLGYVLSDVAP